MPNTAIARADEWAGTMESECGRFLVTNLSKRINPVEDARYDLILGPVAAHNFEKAAIAPMPKSVVLIFAAIVALSLSGCGSANLGPASLDEQQARVTAATAAPKLQAGEKITVTVFGEDKLSGDYVIDPSGFVSLPLAGTIQAAGLTQTELEQALAKNFARNI